MSGFGGFGGFGGQQAGTTTQQQTGQSTGGNAGQGGENPLAFLANNPMFNQLRAAVQQNPELLQTALNQLAQSNPQLFQVKR